MSAVLPIKMLLSGCAPTSKSTDKESTDETTKLPSIFIKDHTDDFSISPDQKPAICVSFIAAGTKHRDIKATNQNGYFSVDLYGRMPEIPKNMIFTADPTFSNILLGERTMKVSRGEAIATLKILLDKVEKGELDLQPKASGFRDPVTESLTQENLRKAIAILEEGSNRQNTLP